MKNIISRLKITWGMVDHKNRCFLYLSIMLFLCTTLLRIATPVFFAFIISSDQDNHLKLLYLFLIYSTFFCILRFLEEFRLACYVYFEQSLQKTLIVTILKKFFRTRFCSARAKSSSELSIIIDRGLSGIRTAIYNSIFNIFPLLFECLVMLAIFWVKAGFLVALELLLIIVIFVISTYFFSAKSQRLQQKWFATSSNNYKIMSEGISSFELLRSFHSTDWMTSRYEKHMDKFIKEVKTSLRPGIILGLIQGILLLLLFFVANVNILYSKTALNDTIPLLILANGLLLQIAIPLLQFSSSYCFFVQGLSSAKQLYDIMLLPTISEKIAHTKNIAINGFKTSNLAINYPGGEIIYYTDYFISANDIVIIAGKSGVGKSSLAKILAGLKEYAGTVETNFCPEEIFYLDQNVDIFDASLSDNVILGKAYNPNQFDHCIADAGFTPSEITNLSARDLGERGSFISGGQAQRIGIARMLYHNARVMIFDEPTSGLDDVAIERVLNAIIKASQGRTTIIVTHDKRVEIIGTAHLYLH